MDDDVEEGVPAGQSPTIQANHTLQRASTGVNGNQRASSNGNQQREPLKKPSAKQRMSSAKQQREPSVYVLQATVLQPKVVLKKELPTPLVKSKPKALLMAIQREGVIQQ
ncbi:MAG: hypothetical protein ABSA11_05980 [Candidatus Bathyarchaeia archaeon]|jgi:hypothetical protein